MRPTRILETLLCVGLLSLSACGGRAVGDGGDDDDDDDDTTDTTGLPDHCVVETDDAPPHELTFSFTRASGDPVYLSHACKLLYSVRSCADDYSLDMKIDHECTPSCADPDEPVACPDCAIGSQIVTTDEPYDLEWDATVYPTPDGCYDVEPLVAGRYRIIVPVYDEVNANAEPQGTERIIELDFELPAPGGVVEVPVD
jgi:hypothetical protein